MDNHRKIWCFGPDTNGPNLLIDCSKGVQVGLKYYLAPTEARTESHLFFAVPERDQGQCCCWLPVGHQGGKFDSVYGIS